MGKIQEKEYRELQITNARWSTEFFLVTPGEKLNTSQLDKYSKLDFNKYYDIQTSPEQSFEECRVYCQTNMHQGMGGMSESSSSSVGFFEAAGLEAKLQSGFLMKINKKVTTQKNAEKEEKERQEKLQELYQKRAKLNKDISKLESKKN